MKVNGQQPPNLSELSAGKSREKGGKIAQERNRDARETSPTSNRTSLATKRIKEAIRNEPDVRDGRVAEIREQLKQGKFKVDTEKLAQNMLIASLKEDVEKP